MKYWMKMRHRRALRAAIGIMFVIVAGAASAHAQAAPDRDAGDDETYTLKRGDNEFGFFAGTSLNTPTLIGTTEDARLSTLALRYGRVFGTKGEVAFEYTVDVVPVAVVSQREFVVREVNPGSSVFSVQETRRSIYGAGISPIGFKFNFRRRARVQPFANVTGGMLYFSRRVPAPGSSQFNFTFDFGAGVQVFTGSRKAVTLGYKFQHISNGGTSPFNPGLDANVVYAGFSIFR